ncbi:MAG: phosphoribosylformylglycinamidine synthase subunit PurS [Gemmatimonadota bacterium]|nr:phosphoribosylformylglycinamidine synthase subunit PurS [Gemmatimonadota bacterium]
MTSTRYRVAVHVVPRQGLLDPQGKAVADALHTLGFASVASVHVGRHLVLEVEAPSEGDAREQTNRMCAQLLANPVTEDFEIASVSSR